ncbi:BTAD domain-containing putative transcriptional regulator [Streptomyces sp. NPDC058694]|uniref:BTAD domain-containing putative transcriptional regulator n=1 Tax=Streptomyces sp. NPDC058694 TaxID=3346603 RepID=UPI003660C05F
MRQTGPAVRAVDAAPALWSGEQPLPGVPGPYAQRHRRRFGDLRLNVQVARLAWADELGEHARVARELVSLIADHPLRDDLYALRVRALFHPGRTTEGVEFFAESDAGVGGEDDPDSPVCFLQEVARLFAAPSSDRVEVNPFAVRHVYGVSDRLRREAARC